MGADLKAFLAEAPDEPIVMLNLLRFVPDGGQRGRKYLQHFRPHAERFGARVLYYGRSGTAIVAEAGQECDAVLLVHYPSRRAFSDMVRDPDYQQGSHLRSAALVEAVLQPTAASELP